MNEDDAPRSHREPLVPRGHIDRLARPPRLVVAALSALLSTCLVFAMLDWWPGNGRAVDAFTNSAVAVVAGVLLMVVGLVWAIKALYVLGRDRRWYWWIVPAPLAVVVAVAAILLIPSRSFQASRNDFEVAAQEFLASQDPVAFDVQVGSYAISRIERSNSGAVYFYDSDQALLTTQGGWVFSPAGPPPSRLGADLVDSTHIDGPWYEFTSVWTD